MDRVLKEDRRLTHKKRREPMDILVVGKRRRKISPLNHLGNRLINTIVVLWETTAEAYRWPEGWCDESGDSTNTALVEESMIDDSVIDNMQK